MTDARVFTKAYPEPDVAPGTLAVINHGDYRTQEVWVSSGTNIGNWYPLGDEFWVVWDRQRMPAGVTKQHPVWADVVARGPVTLMAPVGDSGYRQGWADGRQQLAQQIVDIAGDLP